MPYFYGFDTTYNDDAYLSNGSSLFAAGAGVDTTTVTFSFTGTGFDLISRTGEVQGLINALFDCNGTSLTRICEDRAIALAELKQELEHIDGPIYLVGDGAALAHKHLSADIPELILPPEHRRQQRASGVALAALEAIERGESGDGAALQPNYLRLSQAERERMEKLQANK